MYYMVKTWWEARPEGAAPTDAIIELEAQEAHGAASTGTGTVSIQEDPKVGGGNTNREGSFAKLV